jgi:death on curing protein
LFWLTESIVMGLHRRSIQRFGGADGTRDAGLLQSALARPENIHAYEPDADIFALAAAYCAGIVKNHPFVDGNKRTGTLAAITFLGMNGVLPEFNEAEIVAMIYGLAAGDISEAQLADWIRASATKAD